MSNNKHTNQTLCNEWAKQIHGSLLTEHLQTSHGTMSVVGSVLYSYSTPIGHIVGGTTQRWALLSRNTYSATTAKQLGNARRALGYKNYFSVPYIGISGGRAPRVDTYSIEQMHNANMLSFTTAYNNACNKLARPSRPSSYLMAVQRTDSLIELYTTCVQYAEAFGLALEISLPFVDNSAISLTGKM